jgi:hypothetical protein
LTRTESLDLRQRQVGDVTADIREELVAGECWLGILALCGVNHLVVPDDKVAVLGQAEVELERGDARLESVGKRRQDSLDDLAPTSAVSLEIEVSGRAKRPESQSRF